MNNRLNRREFIIKSMKGIVLISILLISVCGKKNPIKSESEISSNSMGDESGAPQSGHGTLCAYGGKKVILLSGNNI